MYFITAQQAKDLNMQALKQKVKEVMDMEVKFMQLEYPTPEDREYHEQLEGEISVMALDIAGDSKSANELLDELATQIIMEA